MKRIAIAAALVATIALSIAPANAGGTINVREMINLCTSDGVIGKNACMTLIVGFVDGYDYGVRESGGKPTYCRPKGLKNGDMVRQIKSLLPYIDSSDKPFAAASYVTGMMSALYPCGSKV